MGNRQALNRACQQLDLVPKGRDEEGVKFADGVGAPACEFAVNRRLSLCGRGYGCRLRQGSIDVLESAAQ